ncbi:hypothetical protein EUX98_g1336 [Antrodiella citrinella]|uniref:F-box domain-containing protein n=1 Tax=Antrodiella citrinella TaxID=2447956 RepID=A0A4S4N4P5_9APHY|nr:hypothetical protein EUX98_g1336 [Antrodiella citrinella]
MRKYKATLRLHPRHGAQVKELHVRLPKGDEQRVMFSDVMLLLKLHVNPLALQMEHMGSLCLPPMSQRFDPAVWFRNPPATLSPRDVKLRFCHFDSFNSFIRFMHNFSALTDLSVDVVSWESPPTSNDLAPLRGQARPFLLKSLSVGRYCDLDALLRWISTHVGLDHFSRLSFLSLGPTELQRLDLLLPFVRLSLEDLTLGCNFPGLPDTFNRALSTCLCMRTYPRLHTLRLRILDLQPENLQWISQILATLAPKWQDGRTTCPAASRTVATIVFDVWLFAAFQMQDAEWDKIINVLSRIALCDPMDVGDPRRRCFKIVFVHRGTMELPLAADAIKARLSGLRSTTVRIDIVGAGGAP